MNFTTNILNVSQLNLEENSFALRWLCVGTWTWKLRCCLNADCESNYQYFDSWSDEFRRKGFYLVLTILYKMNLNITVLSFGYHGLLILPFLILQSLKRYSFKVLFSVLGRVTNFIYSMWIYKNAKLSNILNIGNQS